MRLSQQCETMLEPLRLCLLLLSLRLSALHQNSDDTQQYRNDWRRKPLRDLRSLDPRIYRMHVHRDDPRKGY